jgi:hypothetical protein
VAPNPTVEERAMKVHRLPLVILIIVLALGAYLAGDAEPETVESASPPPEAIAQAPEGTTSSAWYCGGAPPGVPVESEVLHIANLGDEPTSVVATVRPDDTTIETVPQSIDVPPHTVVAPDRAGLGPSGAVTVETFSRDITVEAGVLSDPQLAVGPCATTTADHWYFAAGTTVRGVQQWLILFNPLGTDAIVDVNLRTDEEVEPVPLRAIGVARHSRTIVSIDNNGQRRRARVAVEVVSRTGRVVAEQAHVFADGTADLVTPGIARSVGVTEPALSWSFASGDNNGAGPSYIAVANTEIVDADIEVSVVPVEGEPAFQELVVPGGGITWVQIGGCGDDPPPSCVPLTAEGRYSVTVESLQDAPIVAEQIVRAAGDVAAGVATTPGVNEGALEWTFARSRTRDQRRSVLALATVGPAVASVTVDIVLQREGRVERRPELQDIEVAPGAPTIVPLGQLTLQWALVVESTGPVVATRTIFGSSDLSIATGVPG